MRFLKTLTLNRRAIYDSRVVLNTDNTFTVADSTAMIVPKSQSSLTAVQTNGMIRYNTDTQEFEGRQDDSWRNFRFKEPNGLIIQDLGVGVETSPTTGYTIFGPLNPDPADPTKTYQSDIVSWDLEQMAKNILVITETIVQLGGVNFDLISTPSTTGIGAEIAATALSLTDNGIQYKITDAGDTDFTAIGSANNTVGTTFTKSGGTGVGTGKVRKVGTYIEFYTYVPDGRTVHAIHNLNQ
jgi:hypothetical protein